MLSVPACSSILTRHHGLNFNKSVLGTQLERKTRTNLCQISFRTLLVCDVPHKPITREYHKTQESNVKMLVGDVQNEIFLVDIEVEKL